MFNAHEIRMVKTLPENLNSNPDYEYGVLKIAIKRSYYDAGDKEMVNEIEAYEKLGNFRKFVSSIENLK